MKWGCYGAIWICFLYPFPAASLSDPDYVFLYLSTQDISLPHPPANRPTRHLSVFLCNQTLLISHHFYHSEMISPAGKGVRREYTPKTTFVLWLESNSTSLPLVKHNTYYHLIRAPAGSTDTSLKHSHAVTSHSATKPRSVGHTVMNASPLI